MVAQPMIRGSNVIKVTAKIFLAVASRPILNFSSRSEVNKSVRPSRVEGLSIARAARIRAKNIFISIYISMKVSVLLPGNSANTVCLTSEKGKVARQQQVVRQAGVRGNLQLLCNWSKAARTGNYKRKPLPHNGALSCLFIEG